MKAYYNEIDPHAAEWLRELIKRRLITPGDVDERSIVEVTPDDVLGYDRVHFFAGIGGWDYALSIAGWDEPCWTGSAPCQPFSVAGKGRGTEDERHLFPVFHALIEKCRPNVVFGEQVSGNNGLKWLSGVRASMEASGYRIGAADLCAAGVGAPHIRSRLYWVADSTSERRRRRGEVEGRGYQESGGSSAVSRMGDLHHQGLERRDGVRLECRDELPAGKAGLASAWSNYSVAQCSDGKSRRFKPGSFPLAHGVSGRMAVRRTVEQASSSHQEEAHWYNRVGALRGIGNAIVPQLAAAFVRSYMECR